MDDSLAFATIAELAPLLQRRDLSPLEVTDYYLDRIDDLNPSLTAYIAVAADRARSAATAAEEAIAGGNYLGPLHGIPLALKDLIDVAGLPTTGGSQLFRHNVPTRDAAVTRGLAGAGAVLLGKTHMVELAFGGVGTNAHHGTPWNPWDTQVQRLPGGSSSGSGVAVAADLCVAALGSDTGGSVRIPSSFCGLVGLKPTFGRISNRGVLPLDSHLDSIGPLCRCVWDAALIFQTLAGPDPDDADTWAQPVCDALDDLEEEVTGMRIALPREYFWDDVDAEVEAAVRASVQVFADLGVHVDEVAVETLADLGEVRSRGTLTAVETFVNYREHLEGDPELFDPRVARRMLAGGEMSAADYFELQRDFEDLRRDIAPALDGIDALLTPTTPFAALPLSEVESDDEYWRINNLCLRNTSAANLLGLCALSLPCGMTRSGLPIGLQLIGKPFAEARVLRLAHAYEQGTEWHELCPPLDEL